YRPRRAAALHCRGANERRARGSEACRRGAYPQDGLAGASLLAPTCRAAPGARERTKMSSGRPARIATASGKFQQTVDVGPHRLIADEPVAMGGRDAGLAPHEFLLAALGTCTSMTVKLYADGKGWALRHV